MPFQANHTPEGNLVSLDEKYKLGSVWLLGLDLRFVTPRIAFPVVTACPKPRVVVDLLAAEVLAMTFGCCASGSVECHGFQVSASLQNEPKKKTSAGFKARVVRVHSCGK